MKECTWFENWFDTTYYHLLYKHRDEFEAQKFISKLITYLNPKENSTALDLACGRGRHSVFLSENKLNVTGIDLSENSIKFAKQFEKSNLEFLVQDMRTSFGENKFDLVFNLFTSFGYFENNDDDIQVLKNIAQSLKQNGKLVLDYLNTTSIPSVVNHIESIEIDGIKFDTSKIVANGFIVKSIRVNDNTVERIYTEKVKLIDKSTFEKYLELTGFKILTCFGDYELNPFAPKSERLIIIAEKK